jgi:very-short-patch-repair endonuclease
MIKFICPFTKKEINPLNRTYAYLKKKSIEKNISIEEMRYLVYLETFGDVVKKENFEYNYINLKMSLPDFKKKFNINYEITLFLLKFFNITKRSYSEAGKASTNKKKQTFLSRYGVDHTFKVKEFEEKRKKTYIEKYGVDNPFKIKNFLKHVEEVYLEKYGCSIREKRSIESKKVWRDKTEEEKREWLAKSIKSTASLENNKQYNESSLEKEFHNILFENKIPFSSQFRIKQYSYDIYLHSFKILIELNGTIWHADPDIYNKNDIMPVSGKRAEDIWEKDKKKIDLAKSIGFTVITIWEKELKLLNEDQKLELLYEKIKNLYENKIN